MNERYGNNPANLKHRITFLNPPGAIVGGWPSTEWTDYKSVRAEIKTQKGSRLFNSDAVQMQGKKIFGIRYKNDFNERMRIRHEKTKVIYEIESMTNDDENNQWYTILVQEVL